MIERAIQIYSFSHLTFQEYFTAKAIINSFDPKNSSNFKLLNNIKHKNWREVFLMATSGMGDADNLLKSMKKKVDALLASDEKLQEFLSWLNKKSLSLEVTCGTVGIRAFYFVHARNLVLDIYSTYDLKLDFELANKLTNMNLNSNHGVQLDLTLADLLHKTFDLDDELNISIADPYEFSRNFKSARKSIKALNLTITPELNKCFEEVETKTANNDEFKNWWQANGQAWVEKLRRVIIDNYKIGYNWFFNSQQQKLINQYYYANKLLLDCIRSNCNLSAEVRKEIEESLLLPIHP